MNELCRFSAPMAETIAPLAISAANEPLEFRATKRVAASKASSTFSAVAEISASAAITGSLSAATQLASGSFAAARHTSLATLAIGTTLRYVAWTAFQEIVGGDI